MSDTIFALATAQGRAGVAVVRVSGPKAWQVARKFVGKLPEPRKAALRRLRDRSGALLDEALLICFAENASFTGEELVEFQLHGGIATVAAVLSALSYEQGLRLAEPGEFTRRALMNGCMDLAQVEGLADLIDAETEAQRRQAQRVLSGHVGRRAEQWRLLLTRAMAFLEASIDFADEDVPVNVIPEVLPNVGRVLRELRKEAAGALVAERIRDGFEIAIVGEPNAGKSTLLNALAGREAAITSEFAGTTRDVIEVRMNLGGLPVTILDTAGLRHTEDVVERMGVERAIERADLADIRIFLLSVDDAEPPLEPRADDILVQGKADMRPGEGLRVSGLTGAGLDELTGLIEEKLRAKMVSVGSLTRERHRLAVVRAIEALESVEKELLDNGAIEVAAEGLRSATRALDSLVGRVDVEDLLDQIFSTFCIGK